MRVFKSFRAGFLLLCALILALLALANKHTVVLSFDPLSVLTQQPPLFSVRIPLFALLLAAVGIGLLIGWGIGRWQRHVPSQSS